jgi:nucleotide-binding universal stress UspA family protein
MLVRIQMLDRLCIAVDGSEVARRAATVGVSIVEEADASVDVVRVLTDAERDDGRAESWDGDRILSDLDESIREASVPIEGHVLEGSPAKAIVEFATGRDADLLVLGRSGRGSIGERLLGSVVHAVLRKAEQPVLTVPRGDGPVRISEVLVPTDGSEAAEGAVPWAAEIAALYGAKIHTCYVLDLAREGGLFSVGGMTGAEIDRLEENRREHLDRLAGLIGETQPGLPIESSVVREEAHAGIADYVAANDVDLVVMRTKGSTSAVGQALGSVTSKVLGAVDVPVLIVGPGME